ncbi:MAG: hypothetical protein ACREVK_00505 [Gammaproteobacteria bacterium]
MLEEEQQRCEATLDALRGQILGKVSGLALPGSISSQRYRRPNCASAAQGA